MTPFLLAEIDLAGAIIGGLGLTVTVIASSLYVGRRVGKVETKLDQVLAGEMPLCVQRGEQLRHVEATVLRHCQELIDLREDHARLARAADI